MCRRLYVLLFLALNLFWLALEAQEPEKPYRLSVGAIFKNEAKFLKEWIEYHRLIGVEHFYLYNCASNDKFLQILDPYIQEKVVTLIHWNCFFENDEKVYRWAFATQIGAYEHLIQVHGKETKWLAFLDINEFLVAPPSGQIYDILDKYRAYPGVTIACDYFDASSKKNMLPKRKLIIETLELIKAPEIHLHKSVAKTIFKPELCHGFTWPPYKCRFKDQLSPIALGKQELRINYYANRKENVFFARAKNHLHVDNRMLSENELNELLFLDYEIEDQDRSIYQRVPELLIRMGYDPSWGW